MFVLKRLGDALAHGDLIYGLVAGIGLSNDVHGDLLAPSSEGQLRAMRMAYEQAGWRPSDIDLIECHAAGTPLGDTVEFESLMSLWGDTDWKKHQCAIGSVKSNTGHTLTAAGAASLLKVLLALKNQTLPPTANFVRLPPKLGTNATPFRVLSRAEAWPRRDALQRRRAAVSGFGFGGINCHVLIEEWDGSLAKNSPPGPNEPRSSRTGTSRSKPVVPIAIVGLSAQFGPFEGEESFANRVLGLDKEVKALEPRNWWGIAGSPVLARSRCDGQSFAGYYIDGLEFGVQEFRIPPKELEEMLPQQSLLLRVTARAIGDTISSVRHGNRTGVLVGIGLDLNATNYHLRWSLADRARDWNDALGLGLTDHELARWIDELRRSAGPPLTANRTMGSLGGLIASRVARELKIGGPSFTVSCDEASGIQALGYSG